MVLIKCRQNVGNKLFITCVFNPVHPHTYNKLTVPSALLTTQTTERSLMFKRGRDKPLSRCGGTESTYNTVVVDVGPAGNVGCRCGTSSKYGLALLIGQPQLSTINPTSLFLRLSCMTIKLWRQGWIFLGIDLA